MRNLWAIMKQFKVLPTNEDFRKLTDDQIDLMIFSMIEDNRQADLARRGVQEDGNYYDDSFEDEVWNKAVGDWDVLKDGHDANDIARQVEQLTKEEDRRNLASKFNSLEDYNAFLARGGENARDSEITQHINRQLRMAEEKARMLEATGKKGKLVDDTTVTEDKSGFDDKLHRPDKEAMEKAIALFNSDDDDFDAI